MLFILFFTLLFRQIKKVSQSSSFVFLPDFGFQTNGQLQINITSTFHKQIFVGLPDPIESATVSSVILGHKNFECSTIKQILQIRYSSLIQISNSTDPTKTGSYFATIDQKNYYTPIFITCDTESETGSHYEYDLTFTNPNTHLDYRKYPCIYTKPATACLFGILLVFWLINWFLNFTLKNSLHTYLTITFIFTLVFNIVSFFEIYHNHKSDLFSYLQYASMFLRVFQEVCLLSAMMMAATGWCIIIDTIDWLKIMKCIVYCLVFIIPMLLIDNYSVFSFISSMSSLYGQIGLFFVGFLGSMLYYRELIRSISEANRVVISHLYLIAQSGINPETTPIFNKCKMFKTISMAVLAYFILIIFKSIFGEVMIVPYWIISMIYDVVTFCLMATAAWIFKLKKTTKNGYMMINTDNNNSDSGRISNGNTINNENNAEFYLEDIDISNFNVRSEEMRQGTEWHEGMALPAQPIIKRKDQNKEKNDESNNMTRPLNQSDEVNAGNEIL